MLASQCIELLNPATEARSSYILKEANTQLSYPGVMVKDQSREEESGLAHWEIGEEKKRSFILKGGRTMRLRS